MDWLLVRNGSESIGFALHIDTMQILERQVPLAIEDGLSFDLVAIDDRGQTTQANIGPGVEYHFHFTTKRRPEIDEDRAQQIWDAIGTGTVGLLIPAIDIDNMPTL